MDLTQLEGRTYGPLSWRINPEAVADFIEVTGDDPVRWTSNAPPGFAAAALFTVAPDLLAELYRHAVIHGEQTFVWNGALPINGELEVTGTVTRVRERGSTYFVTFEVAGGDRLTGKALFLASGDPTSPEPPPVEGSEPPHGFRGEVGDGQVSASRADLVRYAAATRDWNPVHWDHEAAVAAGFPGVVVHGLLQAAWALRAFSDTTSGNISSARFRFRHPLKPGHPVSVD
ncbi:MAG TPA: MaoC/PaaZ C-terminal domain-containing protein, partial [Acidimicrobiia bacterium]|nr:MaoC/PaaZ C-terminal domain-containing protein [Acidimicrobiia bacterium]